MERNLRKNRISKLQSTHRLNICLANLATYSDIHQWTNSQGYKLMDRYRKQTTISNHAFLLVKLFNNVQGFGKLLVIKKSLIIPQNSPFPLENRRNLINQSYKTLRMRKKTPERWIKALFIAFRLYLFKLPTEKYKQIYLPMQLLEARETQNERRKIKLWDTSNTLKQNSQIGTTAP